MSDLQTIDKALHDLKQLQEHASSIAEQPKPTDEPALQRKTTLRSRFTWLSNIDDSEADLNWIWKGFIAPNLITLFSADPKAGKTTLLLHLLLALETQTEFLGQPIRKTNIIVLTEESKKGWYRKRIKVGLKGDGVGIVSRFLCEHKNPSDWENAIKDLRDLCVQEKVELVVFDTLGHFWVITDENQAKPVTDALKSLHLLTEAGIGVLLVHHDRKSGGDNIAATRGSTALTGFVDIKANLKKDNGNRRVLKSDGRYDDETPGELLIELTNNGYELIGTKEDGDLADKLNDVLPLIPVEPDGITISDLLEKLKAQNYQPLPVNSTLFRWLKQAQENEQVKIIGKATQKGTPDLWAKPKNILDTQGVLL